MEIMGDMRKAGLKIGPYAITSLLTSYGLQARVTRDTSMEPEARRKKLNALLAGITELHTMIKLDPSYTVDIALLNALMDAYSRVGAFSEAFEVWEELLERRPREDPKALAELYGPSISVYLDACGYSLSLLRARKAWAWATRWGLVNSKNWDAWLECLCRNGRITEAYNTVVRIRDGDVEGLGSVNNVPEDKGNGRPVFKVEMVEMLLKFSWRDPHTFDWVKRGIKEDFPECWEQVKSIVETKSLRL
jgi:pentatricopeptide repeat protein